MSEEKVVTFPRERHIVRGSFIGMLPEGAGHIRMMAFDGTIVLVTEHCGPYIIRNGVLETGEGFSRLWLPGAGDGLATD